MVDPPGGFLGGLPNPPVGLVDRLLHPGLRLGDGVVPAPVGLGGGLADAAFGLRLAGRLLLNDLLADAGGLVGGLAHPALGLGLAGRLLLGDLLADARRLVGGLAHPAVRLGLAGGLLLGELAHGLGAPGGHRDLEVLLHLLALAGGLLVELLPAPRRLVVELPGLLARRAGDLVRVGARLLQHAPVLGLHLGPAGVQLGDQLLVARPQRRRVRLRLHPDVAGLGLGARPDLVGLVLGEPQHALQPLAEPLQSAGGQGQPIHLAAQVVDLRPGRLQLAGEVVRLGHGGVAVRGE